MYAKAHLAMILSPENMKAFPREVIGEAVAQVPVAAWAFADVMLKAEDE